MSRPLDHRTLHQETLAYTGTCGESRQAGCAGFVPAFRDSTTGRVEIARLADGSPAPVHLISHLPDDWAACRDAEGRVTAVRSGIVAGFVRGDVFYTREEAAAAV
jgi:hypothetical protein